jgi:hypothetical protein
VLVELVAPLSAEQEDLASQAILRLQKGLKSSRLLALPAFIRFLIAVAELVKGSAADRRSSLAMAEVEAEFTQALGSLLSVHKVQGCYMSSVQNSARTLKAVYQKVRGMQANCSKHFRDSQASKFNDFQGKFEAALIKLRGVQCEQFWAGLAVALSSFQATMEGEITEDQLAIVTESLEAKPLSSSVATAALSGIGSVMMPEAVGSHDSVVAAMAGLRAASAKLYQIASEDKDWSLTSAPVKALASAFRTLESVSTTEAANLFGGASVVLPVAGQEAIGIFTKTVVQQSEALIEQIVLTRFGKLHTFVKGAVKIKKKTTQLLIDSSMCPGLDICDDAEALWAQTNRLNIVFWLLLYTWSLALSQ